MLLYYVNIINTRKDSQKTNIYRGEKIVYSKHKKTVTEKQIYRGEKKGP